MDGDVRKLERAAASIVAELVAAERVSSVPFAPFDASVHSPGGEWSAVYLWRNGERQEATCASFPMTTAALESLQDGAFGGGGHGGSAGRPSCAFGSAYFSRLAPGTTLTPHCGPCNARLRCHLPLRVPPATSIGAAACELVVAGRRMTWTEREAMLFDDSFEHSAAYRLPPGAEASGAPARVVLVVDLWHPEVNAVDRRVLSALYPPGL